MLSDSADAFMWRRSRATRCLRVRSMRDRKLLFRGGCVVIMRGTGSAHTRTSLHAELRVRSSLVGR